MFLIPAFKIGIWNAWIFMSIFLLQMLVIMLANKNVKERSHIPKETRQNKLENYIGNIGNFFWLLTLGYSIFLPLQLKTIWFFIGLFIFIIGLTLMVIATYNFIIIPADQLIIQGVYKFSRHPMYLAIFLSIIMAFCLYQEALIEERYCLNKYGNAYQEYIKRTPRWIGLLRKYN